MEKAFPCTKCGACCRNIGNVVQELRAHPPEILDLPKELQIAFPYDFTENGDCVNYDPELGCKIYDERPDICRLDRMFELFYQPVWGQTWEEFVYSQAFCCNTLIDYLELDPAKKVWIKEE